MWGMRGECELCRECGDQSGHTGPGAGDIPSDASQWHNPSQETRSEAGEQNIVINFEEMFLAVAQLFMTDCALWIVERDY